MSREHKKRGIPGQMGGMGMKKHARSGRAPHNKKNAIDRAREVNRIIEQDTKLNEKRRNHGLVSSPMDVYKK